ncbi:MAG: proline racemase [Holophaga sp.]
MKAVRSIHAIDSHTQGEPTRIVIGGIPKIPGETMAAKKQYLEQNQDWLRTSIMLEPRGHSDMFGSIITEPCNKEADFGIIFMDCGGYLNMCGHGSIGAMTVAVETGMVPVVEPVTRILLDTPAGLVRGEVKVEQGRVREVSITNVPSFLYRGGVLVDLPGLGCIPVDIAFGGSFFILVAAERLKLEVTPANLPELRTLALRLRDIVNRNVPIQHPALAHIRTADLVEIYGPAVDPRARYRNVVVFGRGNVDRSPCGTGTSAKMAALHSKGELQVGEDFVYEGILGTLFRGRIMEELKVGEFDAISPRITGMAYITGFNHFVIDEEDPLKYGFAL